MRRHAAIAIGMLAAVVEGSVCLQEDQLDRRLVDAAKANNHAAAIALLTQKVDVNAKEPDGTTALHWAIHNSDVDLVRRLIRAGADIKARNEFGATPLSEAAILANRDVLSDLVEGGADVNAANADGQ